MRNILKLTLLLATFSCTTSDKKIDFEGVWVDKNYIEHKGTMGSSDSRAPFPLILIDKAGTDSLHIYYTPTKKNTYWAEFAYESYFVHLDKHNEYFLIPDIDKGELVYSDMQDKVYGRFQRVNKPLTKEELFSPDFKLDDFIPSAK
jgi:hypothetical protein